MTIARLVNTSLFSIGRPITEKVKTSVIGGKKIREKAGKLTKDLGKPAMSATKKELQSYINAAKSEPERKKRQARVNLASAHKKGLKAKGSKVPTPRKGKVKAESTMRMVRIVNMPAVVVRKHIF